MTRLHAEDLPKSVRDKLGLSATKSTARDRSGTGHAALCPGRCNTCGERFDRYSAFERHPCMTAEKRGAVRWEITLDLHERAFAGGLESGEKLGRALRQQPRPVASPYQSGADMANRTPPTSSETT